jgi:hypothetical protein
MKFAVRLATGLSLLAACSPNAPQSRGPNGWTTKTIPNCCTLAIPPGATITAGQNPTDDPVYLLNGSGFVGLFSVTSRGGGVPLPGSGENYKTADFKVDDAPANTASYRVSDPKYPDRRNLVWTFKGINNGTGRNLLLELSCKDPSCAVFDPMVRSLKK